MKRFRKILILIGLTLVFTACANMRWGTNVGVDVNWGPNGPQVRPHISVDAYSGGRF
jgi:hypothetical protein